MTAANFLFATAPFALLHPPGYLVRTGEYAPGIDWLYAAAAVTIILLSQRRQRGGPDRPGRRVRAGSMGSK